jgi:hypothetical protein
MSMASGVWEPIAARSVKRDRLHWDIERPVLGRGDLRSARVCLIDHLDAPSVIVEER